METFNQFFERLFEKKNLQAYWEGGKLENSKRGKFRKLGGKKKSRPRIQIIEQGVT